MARIRIGAVEINLSLNTGKFQAEIKRTEQTTRKLKNNLQGTRDEVAKFQRQLAGFAVAGFAEK